MLCPKAKLSLRNITSCFKQRFFFFFFFYIVKGCINRAESEISSQTWLSKFSEAFLIVFSVHGY